MQVIYTVVNDYPMKNNGMHKIFINVCINLYIMLVRNIYIVYMSLYDAYYK